MHCHAPRATSLDEYFVLAAARTRAREPDAKLLGRASVAGLRAVP